MNILDTRDLQEKREELKQTILDSFQDTFPHYAEETTEYEGIQLDEEEIKSWKDGWEEELKQIAEIDNIEDEIGREFEDGCTLIEEDDFEEYAEDLCEELGEIPKDLPNYIKNNIDWDGVANEIKQDYSSIEYQGTTYLYRV